MNLLIVDDDQAVLALARYCLSEHYTLYLASSGPEALLVLARHKIDVLVTDQRMPGMDGSELCRQAAEMSPSTAQIMITGYADFQDLRRAVSGGRLTACLQKPLRQPELIAAIERAQRVSSVPPNANGAAVAKIPRVRKLTPKDQDLRAAEADAVAQAAGARAELRASRRALSGSLLLLVPKPS